MFPRIRAFLQGVRSAFSDTSKLAAFVSAAAHAVASGGILGLVLAALQYELGQVAASSIASGAISLAIEILKRFSAPTTAPDVPPAPAG